MNQWRPISICAVLAFLTGLSVWGISGLTKHAIRTLDRWGDAAPDRSKVSALLSQGVSATANADRAAQNLADATGDWSDASKQQARDVRTMLAATGRAIDGVTEDTKALKSELEAMHRTTDAATGLTLALSQDAKTANETIKAAQPLMASLTRNSDDINGVIRTEAPAFHATLVSVQGIAASGDGILADGRKVADKATADYLKPVKWYMQPIKKSSDLLDIGGAIARHIP